MKTRLFFTTILMALGSLFINAQIVHIPDEFTTIQEGIDTAGDGDTVLVADGTYKERIDFKGKDITLASHFLMDGDTSHVTNTVLDGNLGLPGDTASTVLFVSGEDTTSVLMGFTIIGGKGTITQVFEGDDASEARLGGGIACIGSTARIVYNKIVNNSVIHELYAFGGGIGCYTIDSAAWLIVENNSFTNNESKVTLEEGWCSAGGGALYTSSNTRVKGNMIHYNACNSTNESDGAGIEINSLGDVYCIEVYCTNNDIQFNTANGAERGIGGGIKNEWGNIYLIDNVISNNTTFGSSLTAGGGIFMGGTEDYSETVLIENNLFENNNSTGPGWGAGSAIGIWRTGFDITIHKNTFDNNSFVDNDAYSTVMIYNTAPYGATPQSRIEVTSNFFTNNINGVGGGLYLGDILNVEVSNNVFADNESGYGGAMTIGCSAGLEQTHTPVIANNTFHNNSASVGGGSIWSGMKLDLITFNNIFWDNESADGSEIMNQRDSTLVVSNSLIDVNAITGKYDGTNNFYEDPMLDEDGFHLIMGSPCVNTGVESFVFKEMEYHSPLEDIDGEGRPMYEGVDVGADEMFIVGFEEEVIEPAIRYEVAVYPNPAKNFASLDSEYNIDKIEIYNLAGQLLHRETYHQKKVELDLSTINEGMLVIRVLTNEAYSTYKILKH